MASIGRDAMRAAQAAGDGHTEEAIRQARAARQAAREGATDKAITAADAAEAASIRAQAAGEGGGWAEDARWADALARTAAWRAMRAAGRAVPAHAR
jgi:hypothetical protein